MGFTEDSNRATGQTQSSVFKRKAIKPLLKLLEYHINSQIMPEFFPTGNKGPDGMYEIPDFGDVPLQFCFDDYDLTEDKNKHDILEQEIRMGVKTPMMAAKELGINIEELEKEKEELMTQEEDTDMNQEEDTDMNQDEDIDMTEEEPVQEKSEEKDLLKEMDEYIDEVGEQLQKAVESIKVD